MNAVDIHRRVSWPTILPRLGIDPKFLRDRHGPCPGCGGTDPFRFDNQGDRGTFFCNRFGAGDAFSLIQHVHQCNFSTARKMVMTAAGLTDDQAGAEQVQSVRADSKPEKLEWSEQAELIWRRSKPLRGTLGETYLRSRNCVLPPTDSALRYMPPDDRHSPTLVAAITDAETNRPVSLHFTRLAADGTGKAGTDRDRTLLAGHRKSGGVIRLWPDTAVTTGLGIAEGIETALAAAHGFTPMWATIDAGNMASFPVLTAIEALTVFADHDDAGLRAARACADRWRRHAEVLVVVPDRAGHDIADVLS